MIDLTLWLVFIVATCAQPDSGIDECYLPRYEFDFFDLSPKESCNITDDKISCYSARPVYSIRTQLNITRLDEAEMFVDCHGDWVDFSHFGAELRAENITLVAIRFKNCQFVAGTFHSIFTGHENTLKEIEVKCASFTSTVTMPYFRIYKALEKLTMIDSHFFPLATVPWYSDLCIEFPIILKSGRQCFGRNNRKHVELGECFCADQGSTLNVTCFHVKESQIFTALDELYKNGSQPIGSIKIFNLTIDSTFSDHSLDKHWHMFPFAAALAARYRPMYDIRVRNCTYLSKENRTFVIDWLNQGWNFSTFNVSYLTLSACPDPEVKVKTLLPSCWFQRNLNYSSELTVDLGQNEFKEVGITGGYICPVDVLYFYGNKFKSLASITLAAWSTSVHTLNFRSNLLRTIQPGTLSSLQKLRKLDLLNNTVNDRGWPLNTFANATTIEELRIGQDTMGIYSNTFKDTKSLRLLELAQIDHEEEIDALAFVGLGKLKTLRMVDSGLDLLPNSIFKPLYSLETLDCLKMGDAALDSIRQFTQLETIRNFTMMLDYLMPVCSVMSRMPLLETLKPALSALYCEPVQGREQLFKWLKFHIDSGMITIEHMNLIMCKDNPTHESWSDYFARNNFSNVVIQKMPLPKRSAFNMTLISPVPDAVDNPPSLEANMIAFSVCVSLLVGIAFVIPCIIRRKKWFPNSTNAKSWFLGKFTEKRSLLGAADWFHKTSPFDGFAHSDNSSCQCIRVFWHILIAAFAGLTAWQLFQLYWQYKYGGTVVNMSLTNNNTFLQQPFTICMPIVQRNITLSNNDLDRLFRDDLLCRSEPLPLHSVLFANVILHRVGQQQVAELSLKVPENAKSFYNVSHLDSILAKRGLSLRNLMNEISARLCHIMQISAYNTRKTSDGVTQQIPVMSPENCSDLFLNNNYYGLTWYDDIVTQQMCLRFPGLFSFNGTNTLGSLFLTPLYPVSADDTLEVDLDGYNSPRGIEELGNPIRVSTFHNTKITMVLESITQLIEWRDGHRLCYRNCYRSMRLPDIQSRCACRPLMWQNHSNPSLPDCHLALIEKNCSSTSSALGCPGSTPCINFKYGIVTDKLDVTLNGETIIDFEIVNTVYSSLQEQIAMSGSTFLGNLGGVLGFWLSASFMGVIYFVIWTAEFVFVAIQNCTRRGHRKSYPMKANGAIEMGTPSV